MRRRISGIAVSMLMLIAAISMASMVGFAKPDVANKLMAGASDDVADWTIMVYLDGDNNLQPDALNDLAEMEVVGSVGGVNVIVLMDTYDALEGTHWYFIEAGSDHVNVEEGINACECEEIAGGCPGELNMGDPATLTYFLETAVAYAPADHYMLDLWDHGGGWWGVCYDDSSISDGYKDRLIMDEVANAVEASGVHLDIIGYDACFMGMAEVAYENRNIADYMVASITTVPGFGWDYTGLLNSIQALDEKTAEAVAIAAVDAYITSYKSLCAGSGNAGFAYVSASVFDLSKMNDLVIYGIDPLAKALYDLADDYYLRGVIESSESQTPQLQFMGEQFPFIDISWYVTLLADKLPELSAICDTTFGLLDEAIVYVSSVTADYGGALNTYGMSIYFTCSWDKLYENYLTSELDLVNDSFWDEFLFEFSMVYVDDSA